MILHWTHTQYMGGEYVLCFPKGTEDFYMVIIESYFPTSALRKLIYKFDITGFSGFFYLYIQNTCLIYFVDH